MVVYRRRRGRERIAAEEAAAARAAAAEEAAAAAARRDCDSFLFQQSTRLLEDQQKSLDELRARAGTLLSAASLATAFLAKTPLEKWPGWGTLPGVFTVLASTAFLVVLACVIWILWTRKGWVFLLSPDLLAKHWMGPDGPRYRKLALVREKHHGNNEKLMRPLYVAFGVACATLGIEILLWLGALGSLPLSVVTNEAKKEAVVMTCTVSNAFAQHGKETIKATHATPFATLPQGLNPGKEKR